MKNTLLLLFLFPTLSIAQTQITLQDYERKHSAIKNKIAVLSDSLKIIESQILKLKMQEKVINTSGKSINVILRPKGKLREEPSPIGNEMKILEQEIQAMAFDYVDEYLKVCIGADCGFISTVYVISNPEIDQFIADKAAIEKAN